MIEVLMIVKPDGKESFGSILADITSNANVLECREHHVTQEEASKLYEEHQGKYFYNTLIGYITLSSVTLIKLEIEEGNLYLLKNKLRKKYKPQTLYAQCLEGFLHQGLKLDVTKFSNEFFRTFDTVHMSDPHRAAFELGIFFSDVKSLPLPKHYSDLIIDKIQKEAKPLEGVIDCGMFSRLDISSASSVASMEESYPDGGDDPRRTVSSHN